MSTKLFPVEGSTSTPPPVTDTSSKWNSWSVVIGLGALGIAAVAIKMISDSLPSTGPKPKKQEDPVLIKFFSEQHKSGLLSKRGMESINEAKALSFAQFAEGIIRFETTDLKEGDEFFIRCSEYKNFQKVEPFFTQTASPDEDLEFFIPNLPFKSPIKVEFGTPLREISLTLNIDHARGLYTIFKEKMGHESRSAALPTPIIQNAFYINNPGNFLTSPRPESLENPLSIHLSDHNLPQINVASEENGHLIIKNSGDRCVVYLQLTSGKRSIPIHERDLAFPLVISANKTKALTKKVLEDLWRDSYQLATSKTPPQDDLDLRLSAIRQMIYPGLPSSKKTND